MAWIIKAYIPVESEDPEMYATREDTENEEEAIQEARSEQDVPLIQSVFVKSFEPIFETLEPWKECDTAKLKKIKSSRKETMNLESEENLSGKEFKHSIIKQNEELLNTHLCFQTGRCPECGERIYREGGCPICISCGWSPCG